MKLQEQKKASESKCQRIFFKSLHCNRCLVHCPSGEPIPHLRRLRKQSAPTTLDFYIVFSTHLFFECTASSQAWRRQKYVAGELKGSASWLLFIHRLLSLEGILFIYTHSHLQLQIRSLSVPDWSQKKQPLYKGREKKHLYVYLLLCI